PLAAFKEQVVKVDKAVLKENVVGILQIQVTEIQRAPVKGKAPRLVDGNHRPACIVVNGKPDDLAVAVIGAVFKTHADNIVVCRSTKNAIVPALDHITEVAGVEVVGRPGCIFTRGPGIAADVACFRGAASDNIALVHPDG